MPFSIIVHNTQTISTYLNKRFIASIIFSVYQADSKLSNNNG